MEPSSEKPIQRSNLETEGGLQFKFADCGSAGKRAFGEVDGSTEIGGTQIPNGGGEVHAVQYVARVHAEGQVVAAIGGAWAEDGRHAGARTASEAAASAATASMSTARPSSCRSAAAGTTGSRCFPPEAESLAEAQV